MLGVISKFVTGAEIVSIEDPFGAGHINKTALVTVSLGGSQEQFILQRLNDNVFNDPYAVMDNLSIVVDYLAKSAAIIPKAVPLIENERVFLYVECDSKEDKSLFWRCFEFERGTVAHDVVREPRQAYEMARLFGTFTRALQGLDASLLSETIPHFHDAPRRFQALMALVASPPCSERLVKSREVVNTIVQNEDVLSLISDASASGAAPLRVTHNDAKLSNVLFDSVTGAARVVIDLDTVMPGSLLNDFGDMVRSSITLASEDESDISRVQCRLEIFTELVKGFCEGVGKDLFTSTEISLLPRAGTVIALEQAIRFLADYLAGDIYYSTSYTEHNLVRTRVQLEVARQLQALTPAFETIVREVLHSAVHLP